MINIEAVTEELHRAFRFLNNTFFEGELLPEPAITIQSGGKRQTMGWCSREPIWVDSEGKIKMFEINIAAEFLNIDYFETMNTMLHEMVHLYNKIHNVQDVSRNGQYHNKRFKEESIKRGFYFESDKPDSRLGWSFSKLTEESKKKIAEFKINRDIFVIARNTFGTVISVSNQDDPENQSENSTGLNNTLKRKTHIRKYKCPDCGNSVRASKTVNILCGDCNKQMVEKREKDQN